MSIDTTLTERQLECLRLVGQGYRDKEIARALDIHHETVRKHLKSAMSRLGTNSRFVAARRLAMCEADGPARVPPPQAMAQEPSGPPIRLQAAHGGLSGPPDAADGEGREDVLMEDRAAFTRLPFHQMEGFAPLRRDYHGPSPIGRLVAAALLTLLIAMTVISAVPMSNAVQQLANAIDPP